jgi:corrinoid protein of di/trimethylamine methyltransferase
MAVGILDNLKKAVVEYDSEAAAVFARKVIKKQIDPIEALDALTAGIRAVGDAFGKGEIFLPELVAAADAMQSAVPLIEGELRRRGVKRESLGTVVIGTVYGDIHNIGKSMVSTLMTAEGFTVHDLGINVTAGEFVKGVNDYNADILAMSALLTTTAPEQAKVINALNQSGLRHKVKIMVGGAAITADFASSIGADGYDPTAPGAVRLAKRLLRKQ